MALLKLTNVKWLLALAITVFAGAAGAQDGVDYQQGDSLTEPADAQFSEIDEDGDNRISEDEAQDTELSEHFETYDRNEDGELSLEEYHDLDRRMGNDTLNP